MKRNNYICSHLLRNNVIMATLKHIVIAIFFSAFIINIYASVQMSNDEEDLMVDSLINVYNKTTNENQKLQLLNEISLHHNSVDSTIIYSQKLIELATKKDNPYLEARGYYYLSWAQYCSGNYFQASELSGKAILIADSIKNNELLALNYYQLANAYTMLSDVSVAIEYYNKALRLQEEVGDTIKICDILKNMAQINAENMLYDEALECIEKSIKLDSEYESQYYLSEDYYMISYIYYRKYIDYKYTQPNKSLIYEAKKNISKSIELAQNKGYNYGIMRSSTLIGTILIENYDIETNPILKKQILDSCKTFIDKSYALCQKLGQDSEQLDVDNTFVKWLIRDGQKAKAIQTIDSLFHAYNQNSDNLNEDLAHLYHNYSDYYGTYGDPKLALHYEQMYNEMQQLQQKKDYIAKAVRGMAQGDFSQQLHERELRYESKTRIHNIIMLSIAVVLILVIIFTITVIKSYKKTREANQKLDQKNCELEQQKEEMLVQNEYLEQQKEQIETQRKDLQEQNKIITKVNQQITDSINYASLIQRAALPSEGQMNSIFGNHMIIFSPLNIVSGDFYWATQIGKLKMLAVADCTGHGVPGAFLSMLGISILNNISTRATNQNTTAASMLDQMRSIFKLALHQRGGDTDNHDGIDIALIIINPEEMTLSYAGAFRPAILIREHEAIKLDPDRMPIGAHYNEAEHFTNHHLQLQHGDAIYLFTDGMTDQFGYDSQNRLHKYTSKRLRTLLTDIYNQPFSVQKTKIELSFDSWRLETQSLTENGTPYEQTDDALLIGIRV